MTMIDEVGLKENPEDIRYIKRLHQNEIQRHWEGWQIKHDGLDSQFYAII